VSNLRTEVEGGPALAASLNRVADRLDDLPDAGAAAGQAVKSRASSLAPVDTGALAGSITAEWTGNTVDVGSPLRYAPFQEYGTTYVPASPYLRPALEAATTQIVDAYTGAIQKELETVKGA